MQENTQHTFTILDMLLIVTRPLLSFYLDEAIRIREGRSDLTMTRIRMYSNSLALLTTQWRTLKRNKEVRTAMEADCQKKTDYNRCLQVMEDLRKCFMECVIARIESAEEEDILQRILEQNNWTEQNAEA